MIINRKIEPVNEPNITPLCDAAMTLIVIFIMTLPAGIWSGFKVDSTRAARPDKKAEEKATPYVAVSITAKGIYYNGYETTPQKLPEQIKSGLEKLDKKVVVVLPDDDVVLDKVVSVFDIAKLSGAERLALLKPFH